jgi:flavin reductase (DIM6/NTAB) family NADH-FMN oxidoreductase RutF
MYPMTTVLVGATVDGKPNFLTVVWFSMVNFEPPTIAVVLNKEHYTNKGINDNREFSVNFPSSEMIEAVDYCSVVSGFEKDKSKLFNTYYGTLKTAPLIKECPIAVSCMLTKKVALSTHELFIGEIIETRSKEKYLTNGVLDITKIDPVLYTMYDNQYWRLGNDIGKAMHIGKRYEPDK